MTTLTDELRHEYDRLFATCKVRSERITDVDRVVDRAIDSRDRYASIARALGCPWYVVAVIHCLEASLRFDRHLHNVDPLMARTVRVPPGRPPRGDPPFAWEDSARDALELKRYHEWKDWSVPGLLFRLEAYNGWSSRRHHPEVLTPYLGSFTSHYDKGKYVADGKFDHAVSQQVGAAASSAAWSTEALTGSGHRRRLIHHHRHRFPEVVLKRGSSGEAVCRVQARLRELGHAVASVPGCPFGPQDGSGSEGVPTTASPHRRRKGGADDVDRAVQVTDQEGEARRGQSGQELFA